MTNFDSTRLYEEREILDECVKRGRFWKILRRF